MTVALILLSGCAGSRFEAARSRDTAPAYHRFVVDYPNSKYTEQAKQRIDLVRLRNQPSVEGYEAFVRAWPASPLLPEVRAIVEEPAFARARARSSVEAYAEFLTEFPHGKLSAQAQGNRAYLEALGFAGDPAALARFAEEHPASNFAAEAARTAMAVAARSRTAFDTVALSLELTASTPEPERLARVFSERATRSLAAAGVRVVAAGEHEAAVQLVIRHHEGPIETQFDGGGLAERGIVAETAVTLSGPGQQPIWHRTTRFRPPAPPASHDSSLILDAGAQLFWSSFFVPVASWNTREVVRSALPLGESATGLATRGSRAYVLLQDGSFRVFDLADPENPWPLAEYRRPRDLKRFSELRIFGDRAVVFGEDGAEIVALGPEAPRHMRSYDRGSIGTLNSVEAIGGQLVAAGRRGLMALAESNGAAPEMLVSRAIVGLVVVGGHMVFSDGRSVYVTTLPLMREGRVESRLELAPGVRVTGLRVSGERVALLAERGALWLDVSQPTHPRVVGRVEHARAGTIDDVVALGGRVFAVGERGLQLLDPRSGRAIESADVLARGRIATMGRHLVLVGDEWLQVVDATPFLLPPPPAALAQDGESVVSEPLGWDAFADDQDFWATPVER
uniref:Uncharacterized protein n=1 Tax=uncultured bacterium W4-39b TaxID=1130994 RepID=H9BWQ1_9BACT|nr:hypothetical protein [uncultured bacterium W4-39b]